MTDLSAHPLQGVGVLVTRPAGQSDALCAAILAVGGTPVTCPLVGVAPILPSDAALAATRQADWWLFVSANAVRCAKSLWDGGIMPAGTRARVVAIGRATARALQGAGCPVDHVAPPPFDSEAVLTLPELQDLAGQRVALVCGEGGRTLLADTLRTRGGEVVSFAVYRRVALDVDVQDIVARWRQCPVRVAVVSSGEILARLVAVFSQGMGEALWGVPLAVIGPRVAEAALASGFRRVECAREASDQALMDAVVRCVTR